MRKILFPIVFGFSFGMMSCGGPPPAPAEELLYRDVCPALHRVADRVAVTPMPTDRRVAVAKQDPTDEDDYRLRAVAWRNNDGEVEEVFNKIFTWHYALDDLVGLTFYGGDGSRAVASVRAYADLFDRSGEEPESVVTVCTTNPCDEALDPARCEPCEPVVCSEPFTIVGVVNLEDRWEIGVGDRSLGGTVAIRQSGRDLNTLFEEYAPLIEGDRVTFFVGDRRFEGVIAPARDSVDGVVIETEDRGEDRVVDEWSAARVGVDN